MSPKVAVVAHRGKSLGGGLEELRRVLSAWGVENPIWYEVPRSRKAPKCVRRALSEGAELVFAWGGDGMVQRCADALAGSDVELAVLPAGTANLLATNLGIPQTIAGAVHVGLYGARRRLDLGVVKGEHFAVMAGAGFDAAMIRDASTGLKDRIGRAAYIWSGARNIARKPVRAKIDADGRRLVDGPVGCVLVGNMGSLFGGVTVFEQARPDDGLLDVAVITAGNAWQWATVLARALRSRHVGSPFVTIAQARKVRVRFARPVPYELDGGDRGATDRLTFRADPAAVVICVPKGSETAEEQQ